MGLTKFLTLSDGTTVETPNFLRKSEEEIKRLQRVMSRAKKGSRNSRKLALRLAKQHRHVACQRDNHQNKTLATLYKANDILFLEKTICNQHDEEPSSSQEPPRHITWKVPPQGQSKADILGKWFIPIDPWGTTQFCHKCLTWVLKNLGERAYLPELW